MLPQMGNRNCLKQRSSPWLLWRLPTIQRDRRQRRGCRILVPYSPNKFSRMELTDSLTSWSGDTDFLWPGSQVDPLAGKSSLYRRRPMPVAKNWNARPTSRAEATERRPSNHEADPLRQAVCQSLLSPGERAWSAVLSPLVQVLLHRHREFEFEHPCRQSQMTAALR